ncbi:MAG: right-handed parallel beta-helix repeat-containing protein [Oscillospiraceae bacterium]|nr:right-handed parallel beta-helix repeat-containing protein [Oscillospiraceae bacterium]
MRSTKAFRIVLLLTLALALLSGCAAPAAKEPPATETGKEENVVEVASVDELLAAVAPGATVELAAGEYVLKPAAGAGDVNRYCRWVDTYDGCALEIHDADGLTIRGEGADKTVLSAEPRYANVLSFCNCDDLTVSGLTAGHTVEPGACTGGVLYLESCHRAAVEGCGLYGCGTVGVQTQECAGLTVADTKIYECSYNAVSLYNSLDVVVRDCEIYRIGGRDGWPASGLFESVSGENICYLNNRIYDCNAQSLLTSGQSKNVRFLSCDVSGSRFEGPVFSAERYTVTVDGCALRSNSYLGWCGGVRPVDAAGEPLSDEALETMELREIDPASVVSPVPDAAEAAPGGEIRVTDVDGLLAALGPDRTVVLAPGVYDLSRASNYGGAGGAGYYWADSYDGPALVIEGVRGLTLRAESGDSAATVITAVPRYANVITFHNCEELQLIGFTAGHTEAPGECSGGVIDLQNCRDVQLEGCRLYGCGVTGVNAWLCSSVWVNRCEIFDCSWCAAYISSCDGFAFTDCDIHDVPNPALFFESSGEVLWESLAYADGVYDVNGDVLTEHDYDEEYAPIVSDWVDFRTDSPELSFALKVQRVFADGDWAALADLAIFPLRVYTPQGNYVFSDREGLMSGRLDELFDGAFRRQVACMGLYGYYQNSNGSVFADGSMAFERLVTGEGEELRLAAVSTTFGLY